ncbi:DUF1376 domain-containing protein [Sphingobium sp.]|uniref:DUF1376 domain-containing protein n=1 Tax=Sphingobium sp. TaxID=1912891 RepID=UPI0035C73883
MSAQHWHKRYHSDALTGFMSLTLEERGAYQTILDLIYDRGGPIVSNDRLLAGYMGVSLRKWAALRDTLVSKGKIAVEGGHITNERAIFEIKKSLKTSRICAENGSEGGRKSSENRKKSNENKETDQAGLERGSSHTRYQIPEEANASSAGARAREVQDLMLDLCRTARIEPPDPGRNFDKHQTALSIVGEWLEAGADPAMIRELVTKRCAALRTSPRSLGFFDIPVREELERRKSAASALSEATGSIIDRVLGRSAA